MSLSLKPETLAWARLQTESIGTSTSSRLS